MPNTKSAIKYIRTSSERNLRNRAEKSRLATSEKKFYAKLAENDLSGAEDQLKVIFGYLDKAAKHNTIHAAKASRKKGRLAQALNRVKA